MSNPTYINHDQLAEMMRSDATAGKDYAVVDVRGDNEWRGGYISGAIHQPSDQRTEQSVQELVNKLQDVPKVIFHCALSQVRGPKAARIYAEARHKADLKTLAEAPESQSAPSDATTSSDGSLNPYTAHSAPQKQEIYILRDGFEGWQGLYRSDPQLVDKYNTEIRSQLDL